MIYIDFDDRDEPRRGLIGLGKKKRRMMGKMGKKGRKRRRRSLRGKGGGVGEGISWR